MDVLTHILKKCALHQEFKFHYRCDKLRIMSLCFADGLMIFVEGDINFAIYSCLEEFSCISGMKLNPDKSTMFLGNVDDDTKLQLLSIFRISIGSLPVRYLGVPLVSTQLKLRDCTQLVEKIKSKFYNWTNKFLSCAGRLVLIKSMV